LASLEKLCKIFPQNAKQYLDKTKDVYGMNNVVNIKWLELSIANNFDGEKNTSALVNYTSNAWEFRTRNNAFTSIKTLNYVDEKLIANIFDAVLSTNARLSGPASQLAEHYGNQLNYKQMMKNYYLSKSWSDWQKETLKKQIIFL
jgi:hypothetical protein